MEEEPIFNAQRLLESTCDDSELAGQVVAMFLADIPEQLAALDLAIRSGDAKTAERVAHSIKGASATVGGERLRALAYTCERLGHEAKISELDKNQAELRRQFDLLETSLRQEGFVSQ